MAVAVLFCEYLDLGVGEAVVQLVGGLAVPEYVAEGLKHIDMWQYSSSRMIFECHK